MGAATGSNRVDPGHIRTSWDGVAPGYDRFVTESHYRLAEELLDYAGLRPGMRFLDVAAGSGGVSIPAARAGADVLATDISPQMTRRLEERARIEGLSNLAVEVMDGHALDLPDDSFDLAASQFGVMLFADLPRALREMVRVTKLGGRVAIAAMGPPSRIEFLNFFVGAIKRVVPGFAGLPQDPPPLEFQLADPERMRMRLSEAGLRDVTVTTTAERLEFDSGIQLWNWVKHSNPIGAGLVAGLSEEQRAEVQAVLGAKLRERSSESGTSVLTHPVHFGVGSK